MYKIAVCIPTYKRPEMFKKLILSISQAEINPELVRELNILVVDNDLDKSAEITALELKEKLQHCFRIDYHNFPVKGLSNVRNEILRRSKDLNADYLAFVDDDEYVSPEWLNELLKTLITSKGDMIMGPVISVLQHGVSRYISCWFERPGYVNNQRLQYIRTGNLLISSKSVSDRNIRFDPRFNATGGEDAYFGYQMIEQGATVYWSAGAVVFETIPEKRASLSWLIKRSFNGAVTFTKVLKIEKNYMGLLKKILVNIIYFIAGFIALILIPFPFRKKYWGMLRISESLGGFAGLVNIPFRAYA
jgi:succinoglycan biosynthesis protein ExoM